MNICFHSSNTFRPGDSGNSRNTDSGLPYRACVAHPIAEIPDNSGASEVQNALDNSGASEVRNALDKFGASEVLNALDNSGDPQTRD